MTEYPSVGQQVNGRKLYVTRRPYVRHEFKALDPAIFETEDFAEVLAGLPFVALRELALDDGGRR